MLGDSLGKHRQPQIGHVVGQSAGQRLLVDEIAGLHERGGVGNVNSESETGRERLDREQIVDLAGLRAVDADRRQLAQIAPDCALEASPGLRDRTVPAPLPPIS